MAVAVTLRNLTKKFGSTAAVDQLSLDIATGEFVTLLGPSGCGKTTTLRMIAGFIEPDAGEVLVDGRTLSAPGRVVRPEHRNMAMVFQGYALWPHMTVYQNIEYGVKLRGGRGDVRTRVLSMLDVVRMTPFADRYPGELSGGQQQRVALARALAVEPAVMLMDEPLSNLDASLREEMRIEIRRLHTAFGITTIYVTHDLVEAMVVSDRIVVMQHGRIEQVGTHEEIFNAPRTRFVAGFIGKTSFLPGVVDGDGCVLVGEQQLRLRVTAASPYQSGQAVTIALRPHNLQLSRSAHECKDDNVIPGTVVQEVFLGDTREYLIRLAGMETVVRVLHRPDERFEPAEEVFITVPAARCQIVPT